MTRKQLKEYIVEDFRDKVSKNPMLDTFLDAFDEFIGILAEQDLSEGTIEDLYDIFLKDMNIYFKNLKEVEKDEQ